jgi:hypothetical protein
MFASALVDPGRSLIYSISEKLERSAAPDPAVDHVQMARPVARTSAL